MAAKGMKKIPIFVTAGATKNPVRAPRYKIALVKERGSMYVTSKPINHPEMILKQLQDLFEDTDREAFYIICLDQKMKVIGVNLVSTGTLTASLVHPREVFKVAILLNAAWLIAVHNHPSGTPQPSNEDHRLTKRLQDAGELMGIKLRDHIIVADDLYYSFNEHGYL